MKIALIAVGIVILIVLVLGGSLVGSRNQLVTEREAVNAAFANIDTDLQRRNDLIPNLVETVKGFAKHEEEAISSVTMARAEMAGAHTPQEKIAADAKMEPALARLLLVVENYPNLKADENFLRLQDELERSENRIAIARRDYNISVQTYNKDIALFPNNIAAGMFGFQRNDAYFKADEAAKTAPKVKF